MKLTPGAPDSTEEPSAVEESTSRPSLLSAGIGSGARSASVPRTDDVVALDVADGIIVISDDGYKRTDVGMDPVTPHTGTYVITGNYTFTPTGVDHPNTYITVLGGTEDDPISITLDNMTVDNTDNGNTVGTPAALSLGWTHDTGYSPAHVALTMEGDNVLKGGGYGAGIEFRGQEGAISTLTIDGDGSMTVVGGDGGAGIGGSMQNGERYYRLTINGGTINAQGGKYSAGIGGGKNTNNGQIMIHGGDITATGGLYGAGIGGGVQQSGAHYGSLHDMSVTIDGGQIRATGGGFGAGIGTGYMEYKSTPVNPPIRTMSVSIGGTADVTAAGGNYGAGIGGSYNKFVASPWVVDQIKITGGKVGAVGGYGCAGIGSGQSGSAVEEINITGGEIDATGGQWGAGIGSGASIVSGGGGSAATCISRAGDIRILGGTVNARSSLLPNTSGAPCSGPGIGAGYEGTVNGVTIGGAAIVNSTASYFASGIGRCYPSTFSAAFPIVIEPGANVTAYAMGDAYAFMLKADPDDADEPTPDGVSLTALDQECAALAQSIIGANLLMGDFKAIPNETAEQDIQIVSSAIATATLSLPAGFASFAATVPSDSLVKIGGITYVGSAAKRDESLLTAKLPVSGGMNDYWGLQPAAMVTFKVINGTWNGTDGEDKIAAVVLTNGVGTLPASDIPTNMKPSNGYEGGAWDVTPNTAPDGIAGDVTYTFGFTPAAPTTTAIATFKVVNGVWSDGTAADKTANILLTGGRGTLSASDVPIGMRPSNGYEGGKWDRTPDTTSDALTGDMTYTYSFTKQTGGGGGGPGGGSSGGGGGGSSGNTHCTLTYETNGGSQIASERHTSGATVELTKIPALTGHTFTGWYADQALREKITQIKMNGSKTVYAGWAASKVPDGLNVDVHVAYIFGRNDGLIHPNENITRAEVATIFYRLLDEDVRAENETTHNSFSDVSADQWHNTAISTIARMEIVKGRDNGIYDPDAPITRAEFTTIAARFDSDVYSGEDKFQDISGHWAENFINRAAIRGWVQGDSSGNFRPDDLITRAEAVTVINRMLQRLPESTEDLLPDMKTFVDNMDASAWYYLAIQEAGNSHGYERKADGVYEKWTTLVK